MDGDATPPMTQRLAAAAGVERAPAADPWHDLSSGTLETANGRRITFVHPRSPMELLLAQDFDDDEQAFPPYWAELWASGTELAMAVSDASPAGRVLEIGCGLGLPSVAAALAGARVLATDRAPDAVAFAAHNARLSGTAVETAALSWTPGDVLVERGPWDVVLAADVLYNERNVRELLALLPRLLAGGGEAWIADPDRPQAAAFVAATRDAGHPVRVEESATPGVSIIRVRRG